MEVEMLSYLFFYNFFLQNLIKYHFPEKFTAGICVYRLVLKLSAFEIQHTMLLSKRSLQRLIDIETNIVSYISCINLFNITVILICYFNYIYKQQVNVIC